MQNYDKYIQQYGDLFYKQLELESESKKEAENSLKQALDKAKTEGQAGSSKLGEKLTRYVWNDCKDNIKALIVNVKKPKKTTQGRYIKPLEDLLKIYRENEEALEDLLVLSSLTISINKILASENTFSDLAISIGNNIRLEADIEAFYQWEQVNKGTNLKWLKTSMEKGISQRVQESYKIVYAVNRMNKEGYPRISWSKQDTQVLGAKILEVAIKSSNFFVESITSKKIKCLTLTDWFINTWVNNENHLIENAIHYKPTIIPPRQWMSPTEGAYYGDSMLFITLLRLGYFNNNSFTREYRRKLETVDLSYVYDALNAMQDTPFVVNKNILQVMKDIYASGGNLGGLPQTEPFAISKAPDTATEEELKEHKKHLVAIYKQEEVRKSHALRLLMALKTAEKFAAYDKIYFPWNMDYRGRCYPIPTALSPQGDDISKSLLLFAEPSECQHEDDYKWMAIHGANLAGNDKINFADRVKWVEDNTDNIINSAEDALGYQWWYEVSKDDYPMEFLAFCMEWKKLKTYMSTHNNSCVGFKSGLALAFDGTCSGLQHFSALLRDEIGGKAVNLIPSDTVQDIYSIVAEKVNKVLLKDAISGTEDELKPTKDGKLQANKNIKYGTKTLALNWTTFNDMKFGQKGITRKVCKRSVMTLAYGSRLYGFKENLLDDIINPFVLRHPDDSPFVNPMQDAVYMAGLIWDAVATTVVKAVEGMEWLQQIASLICSNSKVVTWNTPNGLPIQQNYMMTEEQVIRLRFNGAQVRFYTNEDNGYINVRSQRNGISPNFIHSMDACHLQRVVVAEHKLGNNNFAMIHDSFGTDIAHAGSLYKTIRQEFIGLYKDQNHLENFLADVKYLIPDDAEIPELPKFGKLNIDDIANSDFCFA